MTHSRGQERGKKMSEKTQKNDYKKYISVLHVVCAFAVVVLHANNSFWQFEKSGRWIFSNFLESIFYFAVPVFMMVSSATLLDYRDRYDTKTFAKKRVQKAVIPYLFWTAVALIVFGATKKIDFQPNPIERIVRAFFHADVYEMNIYNFFLELFVCYLCIPLLSLIPKEKRQKPFLFVIVYFFAAHAVLPLVFNFFGIGITLPKLPILGSYMIFMFIGYYISTYSIGKKWRIVIYALGIGGLLVQLCGTWILSYHYNRLFTIFKGYVNAPSVFYATAVFTFFKHLEGKKICDGLYKICKPFVPTTFGIYLIHRYFILFAWDYLHIAKTSVLFITIGSIVVFFLSYAVVKVLQKIPVVKKILP